MPVFLLQSAKGTAPSASGPMSILVSTAPLVLIVLIFYFLMIRPQNKRQKEMEKMIGALKKGDKVITIGGIHGTVVNTKDSTIIVRVDDNVTMEFNRTAVASVVVAEKEKGAKEKAEKEAEGKNTSGEGENEQKK